MFQSSITELDRGARRAKVIKRLDSRTRSELFEQDKFHTDVETGGGKHAGTPKGCADQPFRAPPMWVTFSSLLCPSQPRISCPFTTASRREHRDSRLEKLKLQL